MHQRLFRPRRAQNLLVFSGKTFGLGLGGGFGLFVFGRSHGNANDRRSHCGFLFLDAPHGENFRLRGSGLTFAAGDDACAHDLFDIGKRKTIEIRKLDEAVFGIDALQSRDEGFDDGLFGNVKRERLFAGFKTEERSPVEFIKNKTETLALTHAACSTANQTCNSGHSDATIRRQSLKENAQNRSSNHKTSQNHTCRYGKIFRTKKHLILPDLGTVFTMSICPIVRRR